MKKIFAMFLMVAILISCTGVAVLAKDVTTLPAHAKAKLVLTKSRNTIIKAQELAKKGGIYTGLGKAVAHQQRARELFRAGWYERAILHARRAKVLAKEVIKANRQEIKDDDDDQLEIKIAIVSDAELDADIKIIVDKDAIKIVIDLD